ncbi:MAG: DJ-1/PfpI family protein [Proteobacteria bacterium]|nr:DJ-1/PfpI family protein [Pseudomonadota bacterium]
MTLKIGLFLFNDVEVLDFSGPFEVFSTASRLCLCEGKSAPFQIVTFSANKPFITTHGGLKIIPNYVFENLPSLDILIIPGDVMTEPLSQPEVLSFLRERASQVKILASVCTGVFMLAEAGLLNGKSVTTHWENLDDLRKYPNLKVLENVKFVEEKGLITSSGISAGIEMSLHLVKKLISFALVQKTARQMEYGWI